MKSALDHFGKPECPDCHSLDVEVIGYMEDAEGYDVPNYWECHNCGNTFSKGASDATGN